MELFLHVLERSVYHIVGGMALLPILQAVWFECRRKGWLPKLSGLLFAGVPALVVLMAVAIREPFDAQMTGLAFKSLIDYATWAFGLLLAAWLQIRYRERYYRYARNTIIQLRESTSRRLGLEGD